MLGRTGRYQDENSWRLLLLMSQWRSEQVVISDENSWRLLLLMSQWRTTGLASTTNLLAR